MTRSEVMRRVRSRGGSAERALRALLRAAGRPGYRLHRADLPGTPDLAYVGRRLAIFMHGCFWHGHACKRGDRPPASNVAYWRAKIVRNRARDAAALEALAALGWRACVVWECELRAPAALTERLLRVIDGDAPREESKR